MPPETDNENKNDDENDDDILPLNVVTHLQSTPSKKKASLQKLEHFRKHSAFMISELKEQGYNDDDDHKNDINKKIIIKEVQKIVRDENDIKQIEQLTQDIEGYKTNIDDIKDELVTKETEMKEIEAELMQHKQWCLYMNILTSA